MSTPRNQIVLLALIMGCAVLASSQAAAQWWSRGPADFEECADAAEKNPAKEARAAALSECNAKFAGRRKPGGGYSYFDFMQNKNFDIAGPNPTPEEQRHIDEQYAIYLESQRRSSIAKQPPKATADLRRIRPIGCPKHSFSCEWPRISEGISDIKKALFGPSGKDKHS